MKKPIAAWLTDLHLKEETIEIVKSIYAQVLQLCVDNDIPGIINGGDLFDNRRKGQPESVLVAFAEVLLAYEIANINFVAFPGNHDKQNLLGVDSTLNAYEGWSKFFLHKEYSSIDFTQGKIRFHFLPYFDEKLAYQQYLNQAIENVRFDYVNILFTHVAIDGVMNNDGSKVSNDIKVQNFKFFHQVLVGHYHNRQSFENVLYTGSAYQANFGEDQEKGCTIIYDDGSIQFHKLEFPKYITFIKKTAGEIVNIPVADGNHYRVKLKYKPEAAEVAELQKLGCKVIYDFKIEHKDHLQDVKTQFSQGDIVKYFSTWCEEQGIEDKQYGLELLK